MSKFRFYCSVKVTINSEMQCVIMFCDQSCFLVNKKGHVLKVKEGVLHFLKMFITCVVSV